MPRFSNPTLKAYARRPPVIAAGAGGLIVLGAILWSTHSLLAFFSIEGLLIVAGGVIAVAFMSFESRDVEKALQAIRTMFDEPSTANKNLHLDMMNIIAWASVFKEKGMRSLESHIGKSGISDPFVKYGLNMVVSQYSPEDVRAMMETAADAGYERDILPVEILHAMASHAPAFGMVGTLVGMVAMLWGLGGDVSNIGPTLAVAFLSTLYGVISARMIYMPAASKLQQEVDARRFRNHLIIEGMVMLVADKTPMHIQDRLNSFLRPEAHDYFDYFNPPSLQAASAAKRASPYLKVVGA